MKHIKRGFFIVFEGIDGSGKTTVSQLVTQQLINLTYPVVPTREPGGSLLGKHIRSWLQNNVDTLDPFTSFLLFSADRLEHIQKIIQPALDMRNIVISDRFSDSSVVYQGHGQQVSLEKIETINRWVTNTLEPDLIIYIRIDAHTAQERTKKRGILEGFDAKPLDFFQRLIDGYERQLHGKDTVIRIDGIQPLERVSEQALNAIQQKLNDYE